MVALAVGFASGCAFAPQAVKLSPEIKVEQSSLGGNQAVRVSVVDERPKSTLGTRGARGVGAELTLEGDLVEIVRTSLGEGLARKGFTAQSLQGAEVPELRVEIRSLDYGVTVGFWSGDLRTQCSLKAICIHGSDRPYEKLHRGEFKENVQVVQGAEANNVYVSNALSEALNSVLADSGLMGCLARQGS
jgi:uncharacterized lipoprotein